MIDTVADASPLIFLAKIEELALLSDYRNVFVPRQVKEEVLSGRNRHSRDFISLSRFIKNPEVTVVETEIIPSLPNYLGKGEKAVISYAVNAGISNVLIDEGKARAVARFYNLKPKGTLGVIYDSFKKGNITSQQLEQISFGLIQKGYRIKEEIIIEFLKRIRGA